MKRIRVLDILLLPRCLYKRYTAKTAFLIPIAVFIGAVDLTFMFGPDILSYFRDKPGSIVLSNVAAAVVTILVIGAVDAFFFSRPLYDLFKHFRKADMQNENAGRLVKIIKVYATAHLPILPVDISFMLLLTAYLKNMPMSVAYAYIIYDYIVVPVWFSAAITRGINAIYENEFDARYRNFVFLAVFVWNYLLGKAFEFAQMHDWFTVLLR